MILMCSIVIKKFEVKSQTEKTMSRDLSFYTNLTIKAFFANKAVQKYLK